MTFKLIFNVLTDHRDPSLQNFKVYLVNSLFIAHHVTAGARAHVHGPRRGTCLAGPVDNVDYHGPCSS